MFSRNLILNKYNLKLIRTITTTNRCLLAADKHSNQTVKLSKQEREEIKKLINYYVYNDLPDKNLENEVKNLKNELRNKVN